MEIFYVEQSSSSGDLWESFGVMVQELDSSQSRDLFLLQEKNVRMNGFDFCRITKKFNLGPFWGLSVPSYPMGTYLQKNWACHFITLNLSKKSVKATVTKAVMNKQTNS